MGKNYNKNYYCYTYCTRFFPSKRIQECPCGSACSSWLNTDNTHDWKVEGMKLPLNECLCKLNQNIYG